ncbi:MAG TPA: hemerythrin domain-containing protein [Candidatus Binatia bacterium]|nr:hemerythrin domain-containing protein [Candidatus Binatia bacterium]
MPILESLAKDHRALEQLLSTLAQTPSSAPEDRIATFGRLQSLVHAHARAEEEVVYRRLRSALPDEEKTLEAYEEHHVADLLLQELASGCPGGPGWSAKLRVFEELLRHHIKEEELTLFKLIGEGFDNAKLARMGEEFELLKHEKLEKFLGPLRRAAPAFAGRATVSAQAAAGRLVRRSELQVRRVLARLGKRRSGAKAREEVAEETVE